MSLQITHRDGTKEPFNADKINRSIERAAQGLLDPISKVIQVATETRLTLYDGISTEEMDQATINAAIQNVQQDPEYDKIATRLLLKTIYKKVVGDYDEDDANDLALKHKEYFPTHIEEGTKNNKFDKRMLEVFNLRELAETLDLSRDELFLYAGLSGLLNRYSIKNAKQEPTETPQYFFMRVAMGLSYNEENPTEWAKKFYHKMSRMDFIAGGSCNLGAGTTRPALSNCFLLQVEDDMEHIAKSVSDVMLLSKMSGGLGVSLTKLRASGSPLVAAGGGASTGPTPFAKIMDTAIRAIQRGGKKKGALAFYMENWHMDFTEFIDWKHNAGDDYARMRTANTAVYISDEFMKRVSADEEWYLFDPKETSDLVELYGSAFSKRYTEYVTMAKEGKMRMYKKLQAKELLRKIIVSLQTTSHPWLVWKDSINLRALNNNTGTIHMSNLCTEICLPQDRENIAVCNLASVNLAQHVNNREVNWQKLEETVRMTVRFLDNLVDTNLLTLPEARRSDSENRAVGLGVMGVADVFEKLGLPYDSIHAYNFADRIFEFISYMAIDESANLATLRGVYKNFPGSGWSKGMVPIDSLRVLENDRGMELKLDKTSHHRGLDWDILRGKVANGIRNATLMAVAPNANIGLLAGTVPGMDARFSQVFSRNKTSGKYLDINHNLVRDLKNLDIWDEVKEKIIENRGDIGDIEIIPQHIREVYKTSFTNSPYAYIEVAARAQKWFDQAISRNIYLETRNVDETMALYSTAWEKGLKSTYYLHMKPRHNAEQSTTHVNKAEIIGKRGFAVLNDKKISGGFQNLVSALPAEAPEPTIVPPIIPASLPVMIDPIESEEKEIVIEKTEPSRVMAFAQIPQQEASNVEVEIPKYNIHVSDPGEENLCDSCQ
ncbi:MAG: ribonucleoside-diphosphate reductase subunit alpha [Candidatus Zambryskibacteria bacterium]|nr:ribonucleoside-diphosphate reductase subunit alpha [Candidatus Zambryskibacteria bacterium]